MIKLLKLTFSFIFICFLISCNKSTRQNKKVTIDQIVQNDISIAKTLDSIEQKKEEKKKEFLDYVLAPDSTDKTCISDVRKAKADIENGKLALVYTDLEAATMRYEYFLKKLCKEKGLIFKIDFIDDVIILDNENAESQTQGYYKAYMNMVLKDSLGVNFKKKLEEKADSLYLVNALENNYAIWYFRCDIKPKPILDSDDYLKTTLTIKDLGLRRNPKGKVLF